ncbi:leucine-rich repeat, immunoglobulin-like domain and transmembrane domain-containing protein 1 isoform X1 [Sardina pilchardus]|uniref:leucine-rich repeat, immunoglobulin-like domain and transmembrane domain-containing protein 1 isoform X1 n=2 Tax=Sardina pilchardus TaxID=27697 RepID=UPI002E151D9B
MPTKGIMPLLAILLLLCPLLLTEGSENDCECPAAATVLSEFPVRVAGGACCLNYSGSDFSHVQWDVFSSQAALRTLDLSHCNISQIHLTEKGGTPAVLQNLYLGHNGLSALPESFLTNASGLRVLDLSMNRLEGLPECFLEGSEELQELDLRGNRLTAISSSLLVRQGWQRLGLSDNPWACTCSLVEGLQGDGLHNSTGGSRLADAVGNLTCASPRSLAGQSAWSLQRTDVCAPAGLTALFILLPLLVLALLVLCWFCGRKRKRKESAAFGLTGKKGSGRGGQRADCNGQRWHHSKHAPVGELAVPREGSKDGIMKNQLLLRPSSALLGSTRDIYEEVEIRLGSVESLTRPPSSISTEKQEPQELGSKPDLETVSVTEVMKDSADREKAYLTQSTEYYSLVPGIEIEDSDHGEYESVDLS